MVWNMRIIASGDTDAARAYRDMGGKTFGIRSFFMTWNSLASWASAQHQRRVGAWALACDRTGSGRAG